MSQGILEGRWEDIPREAGDLSGKRVRLTVLGELRPAATRGAESLFESASADEFETAFDALAYGQRTPTDPPA
jgi:hypothetical protein